MKLMGAAEIATYLGISRQRVQQLMRLDHFPEPEAHLTMGKVWRKKDIVRWTEKYRPWQKPLTHTPQRRSHTD